jgi:hypothetical protein
MKPTLLILAAGMGSRYGKLKQMDGFGPHGETIMEYSIYDAIQAGFGKIVFVVRQSFLEDIQSYFIPRLQGRVEVAFVCQEMDILPKGADVDSVRTKPWGTGHAVWVAKEVINEPFGVINADDYYGVDAYKILSSFLVQQFKSNAPDYAVVGYYLNNTLSEHGTVNRGICNVDQHGNLESVKEVVKIKRNEAGLIAYPDADGEALLSEDTLVSMNMWGFLPSYFSYCENLFAEFLKKEGHNPSSEFFIPVLVDYLIKSNTLKVRVLDTTSDWFGVTYQEDKPFVMEKINHLIRQGVYPEKLWN